MEPPNSKKNRRKTHMTGINVVKEGKHSFYVADEGRYEVFSLICNDFLQIWHWPNISTLVSSV